VSQLDDLQTQFLDYLSGKNKLVEQLVVNQGIVPAPARLNIYKNAYQIRLKQALETDHELLGVYLGDTLFDEMVDGYIQTHPSHYTSLRHFGESLPSYLASTTPFSQHPILAELAQFERRLMDVFDAADAERLDTSTLQQIPADLWPTLRFRFHPSLQLLDTNWNSIESWQALKHNQEPPAAQQGSLQHWMLWRGNSQLSEFRPLDDDEYQLLFQAIKGQPFSELCETILESHHEDMVGTISIEYLSRWFEQEIIIGLATNAGKTANQLIP